MPTIVTDNPYKLILLVDHFEVSAKTHAGDGTVVDPHCEAGMHSEDDVCDSANEARDDSGYLVPATFIACKTTLEDRMSVSRPLSRGR